MDAVKRVKAYQLDDKGQWDDLGTGFVSLQMSGLTARMVVRCEETGMILLDSPIYPPDMYEKQDESLILWSDPDNGVDLALSFQESHGRNEVWDSVCAASLTSPIMADEEGGLEDTPFELPPVQLGKLTALHDMLVQGLRRDVMGQALVDEGYVEKLLELFDVCEDLENTEALHQLFHIFKQLVLLNYGMLLYVLFSEELITRVIGVLEYDPDLPTKPNHREFLNEHVVFKEVVPIENDNLRSLIHQTFRITFIKDVVLPRILDDATFASLNSLIYHNHIKIVTVLKDDPRFFDALFKKYHEAVGDVDTRRDVMLFVQEISVMVKPLPITVRSNFYTAACSQGLVTIFDSALASDDQRTNICAVDALHLLVSHDPTIVQDVIASQSPDYPLFKLIVRCVVGNPSDGQRGQLSDILKHLLNEDAMDDSKKEPFFQLFYRNVVEKLLTPLQEDNLVPTTVPDARGPVKDTVCDILAFCVRSHGTLAKYFLLGHKVPDLVLKLLAHKEKYVCLSALRFFRSLVAMKQEFYERYIVSRRLFDPVFVLFQKVGRRVNLVSSAIIELLSFIHSENIRPLVKYVVENNLPNLTGIKHHFVLDTLKTLHAANLESEDKTETDEEEGARGRWPAQRRGLDEYEEEYFNESSDDEESAMSDVSSASTMSAMPPFQPFGASNKKSPPAAVPSPPGRLSKSPPNSPIRSPRSPNRSRSTSPVISSGVGSGSSSGGGSGRISRKRDHSPESPVVKRRRSDAGEYGSDTGLELRVSLNGKVGDTEMSDSDLATTTTTTTTTTSTSSTATTTTTTAEAAASLGGGVATTATDSSEPVASSVAGSAVGVGGKAGGGETAGKKKGKAAVTNDVSVANTNSSNGESGGGGGGGGGGVGEGEGTGGGGSVDADGDAVMSEAAPAQPAVAASSS